MELPKEFFTPESMLTLTGAAGATFIVSATLQRVLNFNPRWLAFVLAEIIVLGGTLAAGANSFTDYGIGFINGCLVYLTAVGTATAAGAASAAEPGPPSGIKTITKKEMQKRGFLSPWF